MNTSKLLQKITLGAGLALMLGAGAASAAYPEKPINMLTPFAAGGTSDILARMVAEHLNKAWGQPVVVQNKPGAGGQLAMTQLARSEPDGYTLSITSSGTNSINPNIYKNLQYDTLKDLTQVTVLADTPFVLSVAQDNAGIKTLQDFIKSAKAKPGLVSLGNAGVGSHQYLAAHQMASLAKIELNMIPYKGTAGIVTDLIGRNLDAMLDNVVTTTPLVQGKRVQPLAISTRERLPVMPDVATFAELGLPFYSSPYFGLAAPAGTPKAIVDKLQQEIASFLKQPETAKKLQEMGVVGAASTPEETTVRVKSELEEFGKLVKMIGLQPQ